MTLDATARRLATKLIGQFGRTITLTSVAVGAYSPVSGVVAQTTSPVTVKAIVEEYNGFEIANNLAQAGDKKIAVSAADLASRPNPADTVTVDGLVYTIIAVKAVSSGELDALYEIQARLT